VIHFPPTIGKGVVRNGFRLGHSYQTKPVRILWMSRNFWLVCVLNRGINLRDFRNEQLKFPDGGRDDSKSILWVRDQQFNMKNGRQKPCQNKPNVALSSSYKSNFVWKIVTVRYFLAVLSLEKDKKTLKPSTFSVFTAFLGNMGLAGYGLKNRKKHNGQVLSNSY
jgi:hypothetical protein